MMLPIIEMDAVVHRLVSMYLLIVFVEFLMELLHRLLKKYYNSNFIFKLPFFYLRFYKLPLLSNDNVDPCRDGGFEPERLAGREFGFEPFREPPGVMPVVLFGVYETFRGVYRPAVPRLLSLSLNESGVDADNDVLVVLVDIATDRTDLSRTYKYLLKQKHKEKCSLTQTINEYYLTMLIFLFFFL